MSVPVHIVSLGCARNDVDSEEIAARLSEGGFEVVDDPDVAKAVVVNTCGFIEAAKTESIAEILQFKQQGGTRPVIATGCLAQRYGDALAESLPEADAVIGFDGYHDIAETVRQALAGRGRLVRASSGRGLPAASGSGGSARVSPGWRPSQRRRLSDAPSAPLKIASGCDRRCGFCAIPAIRGPFRSRSVDDIVREAAWLASQGVKELFLVSENTTAYGKDLPDRPGLEVVLAELSRLDGIEWIRLSYLQPAEVRPGLIEAVASTPKVVAYFDLPFQHGSATVLRRMRRFGDAESFLGLLDQVRQWLPQAGVRANFIVGFPGETEADVAILTDFLAQARLDAVGVFAYSDEEGTPAAALDAHLDPAEIAARTSDVSVFADTVASIRAEERIGQEAQVLIESGLDSGWVGRSAQQGPQDGQSLIMGDVGDIRPGSLVTGRLVATQGVDWLVDISGRSAGS